MTVEIAIDIGGTFTDLYIEGESGESNSYKVPTTPDDFTVGFFNALEKAADNRDQTVETLLGETSRLIHGTTIATNAIIEHTIPKTALICTDGFSDTLWLREGGKSDPYDWDVDYPDPFIPKALTVTVDERINAEGGIEKSLDSNEVESIVESLRERDVEAVAVTLLWSHVNDVHERLIGEIIDDVAPEMHYSLSHEVNPIIREYRRTCSTAFDAALYGPINEYLSRLNEKVEEFGYENELLIIAANGGVMTVEEIAENPIWTVDSGPTVLPVATQHYIRNEFDRENVIALDMGGTSLDMGVVTDGSIPRTREAKVGNDLLGIEKVEVKSIGSGGGSIAWVDEGGLLHVGPESAGADPGPVCYGKGGKRPTVTDAALVLGYLNDDWFLGGDMTIDRSAAKAAIVESVGDELGLTPIKAAFSIFATANQNMINGIKEVTISRGIDPRQYVLSGGGGALGTHIVALARELQIEEILLPGQAGVVSSTGGLVSDIRRDFSASYYTRSDRFEADVIEDLLTDLQKNGKDFLDRTGIEDANREIRFYTEGRYPSQVWELPVELDGPSLGSNPGPSIAKRFHDVHEDKYGFQTDQPVEFLYWRAEAIGQRAETLETATEDEGESVSLDEARHGTREAYFDDELVTVPAYRATKLVTGHEFSGPAFVDADNTTIVVPPGCTLSVTAAGNYHLKT